MTQVFANCISIYLVPFEILCILFDALKHHSEKSTTFPRLSERFMAQKKAKRIKYDCTQDENMGDLQGRNYPCPLLHARHLTVTTYWQVSDTHL